MSSVVDLTSPREKTRRITLAEKVRNDNLQAAKKAQIESQVAAKKKAEKRKEMTSKRLAKRKRTDDEDEELPNTKKPKNEGRVIDYTERDHEHVKRLFHTNISYFGNVHTLGLFCGYDCSVCPALVFPIFTGPATEKKQSVYTRKYILGVGKSSNVITGIKQAFTELYPHLPADRVYDWKLMKWNKKAYKAATLTTAVDPAVLSMKLYSSKSFGGAGNLPAVKITDDLVSNRKMECGIEVATYIKNCVPDDIKRNFPNYGTLSFADIKSTLEAAAETQKKTKEIEQRVDEVVEQSDIIKETFEKREQLQDNDSGSETEEAEYSDEE